MLKKWALRLVILLAIVLVLGGGGLATFVETTWKSNQQFPSTAEPDIHASSDPAVIERGRTLTHGVAHCAACHGTYDAEHPEVLREDVALSGGGAISPPFGTFYAPNITQHREDGIGAWSDGEIARVIRTGVRRNGELSAFMKFAVGEMSDEDLTAIVSYLRTVRPVRRRSPESAPNFLGHAIFAFAPMQPDAGRAMRHVPESAEPSIARGEYLASGPGMCAGCHTPASEEDMFTPDRSRLFAGGQAMEGHVASEGEVEYSPPNLTRDRTTGYTGRASEDVFVQRFREIGRTGLGSPMPWENYARMSDADLRSIYRYIVSLPAVRRDTGPNSRAPGSFDVAE
jgi:mono/diheme cytochrome c family protein